jgi:purine-binding chemotaxis protein CheW
LFGTPTQVVKEVTALPPLTPIPHAPVAVRGYVNLRGHIVLVVDLNCLFEREPTVLGPECRLIVFKPEVGESMGALVQRIGDIVELHAEQIEAHHAGNTTGGASAAVLPEQELVVGVGKLAGELLLILDARQLRPCLTQAVARRGQASATYRNEVPTVPPPSGPMS